MTQIKVQINKEDCTKLEALHYSVEARIGLFSRLLTMTNTDPLNSYYDKFMKEYEEIYKEYVRMKQAMEAKYKPAEIAETAKNWTISFADCEITFEV